MNMIHHDAAIAADTHAAFSRAMAVPATSAQSQLAAAQEASRKALRDAEATIADIADRRGLLMAEYIKGRETAVAKHDETMGAIIARERADVDRLADALEQAKARLFAAEQAHRDGRKQIQDETKAEHNMALAALADEEAAALMVKAMAEAGLSVSAKAVMP
jgi:uncharacterized protein YecA (UPF0149 family)